MTIKKVLIYRLGSLGDTIVALPAFHLIARAFPDSERLVLTNIPTEKASPMRAVLEGTNLVHGYISYPLGLRDFKKLTELRNQIRRLRPDVLVYFTEPRGRVKTFRDAVFFKLCGVKKMIGFPFTASLERNRYIDDTDQFEHEASRLSRCLISLGEARLNDPLSWDLQLRDHEQDRAKKVLQSFRPGLPFIACSVGTKVDVKDWGQENWRNLIRQLLHRYKDYGLALIGSKEEFSYSENVSSPWFGPKLNLCGMLTIRESATVLKLATIFIGHDSGPMHLAASVGTPCVAIFSARNKPGVWFPYGVQHRVIYYKTNCYGCGLDVCKREKKRCITSITPEDVSDAFDQVMQNINT